MNYPTRLLRFGGTVLIAFVLTNLLFFTMGAKTARSLDPVDRNASLAAPPVLFATVGLTFTVNITDDVDDGTCDSTHCSLREAINAANALTDTDAIVFDIPGVGPHTIQPLSALPVISSPVLIDGTSEPEFTGTLLIQLDGSQAGSGAAGLQLSGGDSRVHGLVLSQFEGTGVAVISGTGTAIWGNSIASNGELGIDLGADGITLNDVGDPDTGPNNRQNFPVLSSAIGGNNTTIAGTLNSTPHTVFSLEFFANTNCDALDHGEGETFLGSIMATTGGNGNVAFTANLSATVLTGQFVTATATDPDNNTSEFSQCTTVQTAKFIVNTTDDANAVCSAAHCSLREAIKAANAGPGMDTIAFNIPGQGPHTIEPTTELPTITDPVITDGTTQPGFAGSPVMEVTGLKADEGDGGLHITGGNSTIRGLIIRDFGYHGIEIIEKGNNIIQGNVIENSLEAGIFIWGTSNNIIGGPTPGLGNIIAFNDDAGVGIIVTDGMIGTGNLIQGNSIFGSAGLGIDLSNQGFLDGVTPNDAGDVDTGSNRLQNFPVLTSVISNSSGIIIEGTLNSTSNTLFQLDFYANNECDNDGHGQGETFVGSTTVTTNGSGDATFTATFSTTIPAGNFLTATATDPNNNTSEFSQCLQGPALDTTAPVFPDSPLISPILGANVSTSKPTFDWKDATDRDDNNNPQPKICYIVIITSDEAFVLPAPPSQCDTIIFLSDEQSVRTTQSVYTPTVDLPDGVYTWTVKAIDPAGNVSDPIPAQTFTIQVMPKIYLPIIMKN